MVNRPGHVRPDGTSQPQPSTNVDATAFIFEKFSSMASLSSFPPIKQTNTHTRARACAVSKRLRASTSLCMLTFVLTVCHCMNGGANWKLQRLPQQLMVRMDRLLQWSNDVTRSGLNSEFAWTATRVERRANSARVPLYKSDHPKSLVLKGSPINTSLTTSRRYKLETLFSIFSWQILKSLSCVAVN